jgi:hypothetical protein
MSFDCDLGWDFAAFDNVDVIGDEHDFVAMIDDFAAFEYAAGTRSLRIILLGDDRRAGSDRISDENWFYEA